MEILVTGGLGYIGSHITVELLNQGFDVVILDNCSNSHPDVISRINKITNRPVTFYNYDLRIKDNVKQVFHNHKIDAVIHCAGYKAVGESKQDPLKYYENNLTSTIVLLEVMKDNNVKKLVFSSSATVYAPQDDKAVTEDSLLKPSNPYGQTKLIIEQMLNELYESDNSWRIVILRYFNPAGAHPSGLIGENPSGIPNNLFPYVSRVVLDELPFVNIFGNDYDTLDGTGVRDYIHVVDLAEGHVSSINMLLTNSGIHTFNLGTGRGYSVLDVIEAYQNITKKKINYKTIQRRAGDIAISFADTSKANEKLKWCANKDIYAMCEDEWNWLKKYRDENPN